MTYTAQFALIASDKTAFGWSQITADYGGGARWFGCAHRVHPGVQQNVHEQQEK